MLFPQQDIARTTLSVLFIAGLLAATFWVLQPFLPAIVWAMTLVIATWPLMLKVQTRCGNRRWLAVTVMTLALMLVLIVPFWLAISTLIAHSTEIAGQAQALLSIQVPPPPVWLREVPFVGESAHEAWTQVVALKIYELAPPIGPYSGALTQWLASAAGSLTGFLVQVVLAAGLAAWMYARGEDAGTAAIRFGGRLGGESGEKTILLAARAIRGVALGVVVTALAQSVIAGIGLVVVGIPFAPVLTALTFLLCLVQVGPGLVLVPAVLWMYYVGDTLWGTVLLAFTLVAVTLDNVLRPFLIKRGADLPLLLVLVGVIGGLIAFGILGIFLGPTVLAVAYTLLTAWIAKEDEFEPPLKTE